jgi:hypothetical protein
LFLEASDQSLFFGRDPLGRRSLLLRQSAALHWSLDLASVSCGPSNDPSGEFREVSARAIYQLHLDQLDVPSLSLDPVFERLDGIVNNGNLTPIRNVRGMIQTYERSYREAFVCGARPVDLK